jgi:hypothetical protein
MHREKIRPNAVILSFLISVVSIRFLSVRWYFHYGPPVVAPLVLSCLPAVTSGRQKMIPKWVLGSALVILIAINGGELTRNLGTIFGRGADMCEGGRDRLVSINRGVDFLSGHIEGRVLVGGNLLPALAARPEIYQVGGEQSGDASQEPYRYVFVEKPPRGDPWPLDRQRIEELIGIWRGMDSVIVHYDDGYVFLAEGLFFTDE